MSQNFFGECVFLKTIPFRQLYYYYAYCSPYMKQLWKRCAFITIRNSYLWCRARHFSLRLYEDRDDSFQRLIMKQKPPLSTMLMNDDLTMTNGWIPLTQTGSDVSTPLKQASHFMLPSQKTQWYLCTSVIAQGSLFLCNIGQMHRCWVKLSAFVNACFSACFPASMGFLKKHWGWKGITMWCTLPGGTSSLQGTVGRAAKAQSSVLQLML